MVRVCITPTTSSETHFLDEGTVIADIATSRADIEASRLLVLSAAHQVSLPVNIGSGPTHVPPRSTSSKLREL